MRHHICRRRLAADPHDTSVAGHLARCASCRGHAERLRTVVEHAPALAPTPPAGLTERLLASVRSDREEPSPLLASVSHGRPRGLLPLAAAAASVFALAATALALRGGDDPPSVATGSPELALATATSSAAIADSFVFEIEGSFRSRFDLPTFPHGAGGSPLSPPQLPLAFSPPEEMLEGLPEDVAERMREQFRQASERMEQRHEPIEVPSSSGGPVERTVRFSASGAVARPDRARASGTLVAEDGPQGPTTHHLDVVIVDDTIYLDHGDGWVRLALDNSPLPVPLVDVRSSFDVLRRPLAPVEELGTERLDGETVRHLRLTVPGPEAGAGSFTAEVWIGEDGVIRQIRTQGRTGGEGMPIQIHSDITVRITEVNVPVEISPPADARDAGDFPFGFGFSFALDHD